MISRSGANRLSAAAAAITSGHGWMTWSVNSSSVSVIACRTSQSGIGADGRPLHTQLLVRPFSADPEVWGYRIEQRAPGRFEAQVLAAPGADPAAVTARVRERFSRMVGPEESIALSFVDELPRTPAGKVMRVTGGRRDQGASKYPGTRAQAAGPGS